MTKHYIPKVTFKSTNTLHCLFIRIPVHFLLNTVIKILLVVFIDAVKNVL